MFKKGANALIGTVVLVLSPLMCLYHAKHNWHLPHAWLWYHQLMLDWNCVFFPHLWQHNVIYDFSVCAFYVDDTDAVIGLTVDVSPPQILSI